MPPPAPVLRIALVGDRDDRHVAHQAIPEALRLAGEGAGTPVAAAWVPTDAVADPFDEPLDAGAYHGVWCVPASPYRSEAGALRAIRAARERGVPFLGTCGGFQHAVLEFARAVLGLAAAAHAENDPDAALPVVTPLACALLGARGRVRLAPGSRLARAYGGGEAAAEYQCAYGLDPAFRARLAGTALRVTAEDDAGDARAVELDGHPFFVATLFQPEREALARDGRPGRAPPLVAAFVAAAAVRAGVRATAAAAR